MTSKPKDLIPDGCILLASALEQYRGRKWADALPEDILAGAEMSPSWATDAGNRRMRRLADAHQSDINEIVDALLSGRLRALVRPPGQVENFVIDRHEWGQFFPERPFLDPVLDNSWNEHRGRTPFLRSEDFASWVEQVVTARADMTREPTLSEQIVSEIMGELVADHTWPPGEADDQRRQWHIPIDPTTIDSHEEYLAAVTPFGGYWTLDQALSWTMWRRADRIDLDPIVSSIMALEPDAERPRHSFTSAASMVLAILRQGLVEVTWTDAATGEVSQVPRMQFAAASIIHSSDGHVVKVPRQEGENPLFSGHINMLRLSAVDTLKVLAPDKQGTTYDGPLQAPSPFPAPAEDDEFADDTMTLGDAALWIASEGYPFSNSDERAERLELIGVPRLLAALKRGKLQAVGYNNRTMELDKLGKDAWANTVYERVEEGRDIVSFLDFEAKLESGGTLTRWANHRNERPDWSRIRIDAGELRRHFPEMADLSSLAEEGNEGAVAKTSLTPTEEAIADAIRKKWPLGLPVFRSKTERDNAIFLAMKDQVSTVARPNDVTFRRYFQKIEATGRDK